MIERDEASQANLTSPPRTKRGAPPDAAYPTWRVQIYHRETGAVLRLGGRPLTLFGKNRGDVEDTALSGRDPRVWRAIATPLAATGA